MAEVQWGALMRPIDYFGNTMRGFEAGRKAAQEAALAKAMKALSAGPNPDALRVVYQINPQLGMQVEDQMFQRDERQRQGVARDAMVQMLLGGPPPQAPANALMAGRAPGAPAGNALALPPPTGPDGSVSSRDLPAPTGTVANPAQPTVSGADLAFPRPTGSAPPDISNDPLAPLSDARAQQAPQAMAPAQEQEWNGYIGKLAAWADSPEKWDQAVDYLVANGQPGAAQFKGQFSPQGRAALMQRGGVGGGRSDAERRLIEADPEGYLTFQGKRLDVTGKQLKNHIDVNNAAMQILGSVHDQASYDAAKQQALQVYSSFGHDAGEFISQLPPQYSPETIRMLQLRGIDSGKQLAAIARENNIESQIEVREQRADEYSRHNRAMESNTRRGQDRRGSGGRSSAPKAPTPTTVIGRIMDKQARGEVLTPAEQATYDEHRAGKGGGKRGGRGGVISVRTIGEARELPPGTLFKGPDGRIRKR